MYSQFLKITHFGVQVFSNMFLKFILHITLNKNGEILSISNYSKSINDAPLIARLLSLSLKLLNALKSRLLLLFKLTSNKSELSLGCKNCPPCTLFEFNFFFFLFQSITISISKSFSLAISWNSPIK